LARRSAPTDRHRETDPTPRPSPHTQARPTPALWRRLCHQGLARAVIGGVHWNPDGGIVWLSGPTRPGVEPPRCAFRETRPAGSGSPCERRPTRLQVRSEPRHGVAVLAGVNDGTPSPSLPTKSLTPRTSGTRTRKKERRSRQISAVPSIAPFPRCARLNRIAPRWCRGRFEFFAKVETAGSTGPKFAVRVRGFDHVRQPSCGRLDRRRPSACGRQQPNASRSARQTCVIRRAES
jgi:hypothetical protein